MPLKALFIVTGADRWTLREGPPHPTGFWADELVDPHRLLRAAGVEITIATPGGRKPVVDPSSMSPEVLGPAHTKALADYLESIKSELATPIRIEDVVPANYDMVFVPGGHGPMEDLAVHHPTGRVLTEMLELGRKVAIVCHAPASMFTAKRGDGTWAFKGYRMTAFTNEEETQAGHAARAPWLLEDRLRALGAVFENGPAWSVHVVVDRNLYTGQNPMSAGPVAQRVLDDIAKA
jgi:putative intracellular protease/amidase